MHLASHGLHGVERAVFTARATCGHILPARSDLQRLRLKAGSQLDVFGPSTALQASQHDHMPRGNTYEAACACLYRHSIYSGALV